MLSALRPQALARQVLAPCSRQAGLARSMSDTSASSPPGYYYNSQLGQHIRISGAAGIRIHDISARTGVWDAGFSSLSKLIKAKPTSIEMPFETKAGKEISMPEEAQSLGDVVLACRAHTQADAEAWSQAGGVAAASKMVLVDVDVGGGSDALGEAVELIKASRGMGMQVKACVHGAFEDGCDPFDVEDCVLAVADAGTDVIVVVDREGKADDFDVIERLETLLGMDVAGESMMERLGFCGTEEGCLAAAKLGATHFETVTLRGKADAYKGASASGELAKRLKEQGKTVSFEEA